MHSRTLGLGLTICLLGATRAAAQTAPPPSRPLTLQQAEQRALQQHPLVHAGQDQAQAAAQVVREVRSAYFPTTSGAVTGADEAPNASRVAAGGLNNPTILERLALGVNVSQLLTDFGRTHDLVQSSTLTAQSTAKIVAASRAGVLLGVDRAYFNALRARAVLRVAQETVDTRKTVADQVQTLANSNLKSGLDVSFANVNLSEAQLLLVQAQNDIQASLAALADAMGDTGIPNYELSEEPQPPPPPDDSSQLVVDALKARPDIEAQKLAGQAAMAFAKAEGALWMPTVAAVGVAGWSPYHETGITDRYSAAAVNVTIPVTNGRLFGARHAAALFRADAQLQVSRELENGVSRDVTLAWLAAKTAYQRLGLTAQLLSQASDALDLAQARYNLGLTSIVELTQAQLNKTSAEIAQSSARYDYQASIAALRYQTGQLR